MKSIAITIDEETLAALDQLVDKARPAPKRRSRSAVIRAALREYVVRQRRAHRERAEAAAYAKHRERLDTELKALVDTQAIP